MDYILGVVFELPNREPWSELLIPHMACMSRTPRGAATEMILLFGGLHKLMQLLLNLKQPRRLKMSVAEPSKFACNGGGDCARRGACSTYMYRLPVGKWAPFESDT